MEAKCLVAEISRSSWCMTDAFDNGVCRLESAVAGLLSLARCMLAREVLRLGMRCHGSVMIDEVLVVQTCIENKVHVNSP